MEGRKGRNMVGGAITGLRDLKPLHVNVGFVAFVIALAAFVVSVVQYAGGPEVSAFDYLPNLRFYLYITIVYVAFAIVYLLARHRPPSPSRFLIRSDPAHRLWRAVVNGLPLLIAVSIFMPSFSFVKSSIPLFNDYSWDATFIWLDRAIHGTDPWRLLQPLLGYPSVTSALAITYHLWFLLIYLGTVFFAISVKDHRLCARYFLSYLMLWTVGGMAMAVGLASVGPCFVEPLLGNPYYAEQTRYLSQAGEQYFVPVLEIQRELIAWYRAGDYGFGRGISAMPSMHVGLAFLFFLAVRRLSQWAGWFFGLFCFVIVISSIHLGYHYAVDGYASLALVAAIWWLSGKLVAKFHAPELEPPSQQKSTLFSSLPGHRNASPPAASL